VAWLASAVVVLAAAVGSAWWFKYRETDDDRYLAALSGGGFQDQYATPDVALAAGHAFCAKLSAGASPKGFDYQQVAVKELCPQFKASFTVVATPEQQAADFTMRLRDQGLGGKFSSDAAAVSHAESVCQGLDDGAAQQGPEEDAVAVSVYCPKYETGFKTLEPITVNGTFTVSDDDPSTWFPSISGTDKNCSGDGGYSDISAGTEVVVKNSAGDILATSTLGQGHGIVPYLCKFRFKFSVMDGETGGYMITVSHRGDLHYTAAQLKLPGSVAISLG
jgi:Protein of unknown function (DUF732)